MNSVLIHIPKTAGSYCMSRLGLQNLSFPRKARAARPHKGHLTFGHQNYPEMVRRGIVRRQFYLSAFVYGFCRNPYDRAVSHFHFTKERRPDIVPRDVTFAEFSRRIGSFKTPRDLIRRVASDVWFRPQYECMHGMVFDFIGRYERLEEDLKRLAHILGIELRPAKRSRVSRHEPYWTYYDEETMNNVREYYARDFEVFRYDPAVLY